jgi:hypothetical protein
MVYDMNNPVMHSAILQEVGGRYVPSRELCTSHPDLEMRVLIGTKTRTGTPNEKTARSLAHRPSAILFIDYSTRVGVLTKGVLSHARQKNVVSKYHSMRTRVYAQVIYSISPKHP